MKMAFHRRNCTIVVKIIAELKTIFKNRRKHVIINALLMKIKLSIIVLPLNSRILFFLKKGLELEFRD